MGTRTTIQEEKKSQINPNSQALITDRRIKGKKKPKHQSIQTGLKV